MSPEDYPLPEEFPGQTPPPEDAGKRRLPFRSAGDMVKAPTPVRWLVKPFIEVGTLIVLFGAAGVMKSFIAIALGLCVATGRAWHDYPVRMIGPVFYLCGEGFSGLSRRLYAWALHYGVDLERVPFFVSERPAQFLDAAGPAEILAAFDGLQAEHGPPALVIVDTLNRNFGPGDENSTADMTRAISVADQIRSRYGCAVLFVHHSGLSAIDRARGSSSLRGAADSEYMVTLDDCGTRTLSATKVKDHDPPPDISFKPEIVQLSDWIDPDDGQVMTSVILRKCEETTLVGKKARRPPFSQRIALSALRELVEAAEPQEVKGALVKAVHVDDWREAAYSAGISPTGTAGGKQRSFRRAVDELFAGKLIETFNDLWWPRDTDKARQCPDNVWQDPRQTGHTPLGVSVVSGCTGNDTSDEEDDFEYLWNKTR
ncbi:MAG: AAA family ATPase [Desulfuromonadales bacterium]|nr:AAA family ATPase [Desulfuromonadales bacterium]